MIKRLPRTVSIVKLMRTSTTSNCLRVSYSRLKYWKLFSVKFCSAGVILPCALRIGMLDMKSTSVINFIELDADLERMDRLHDIGLLEDEYSNLCLLLKCNPDNWKLLWRLARAAYLLAQKPDQEKNRRKKLIDDALVYSQRSSVAALNWFQRRAILFLCPTFPDASYEEALSYFEKAETISPGSASCSDLVTAAKCYLKFDQRDKSLGLLHRAKSLSPRTVDDQIAQSEATKLLKNIK